MKDTIDKWGLSTGTNRLSRFNLEQKGTTSDKGKLPPEPHRNKPKGKVQWGQKASDNPLHSN